MQIHARTQNDVTAIFQGLVANGLPYLLYQLCIPRRCQTGTNRETCCGIAVRIVVATGINMDTGRTVGHYRSRNAQTLDSHRRASRSCHQFLLMAQHGTRTYKGLITTAHQ